jgi:hypothetical protein
LEILRATINLAEDALIAARDIARRERPSLGEAVSELIRRGSAAGAHQSSERANRFIETRGVQIATCPLVESGIIRTMSSPSYSRRGVPPLQQLRTKLRQACGQLDPGLWPDDISFPAR